MATFEEQIEGLTSLSIDGSSAPTQNEITQFLTDGAKEIINTLPTHLLPLCSAEQSFTSGSASTLNTGKILNVFRSDGDIKQPCRAISSSNKGRYSDPDDMNYATITDPVYYMDNNTMDVLPNGGSVTYSEVQYPAVLYSASSINVFPDEAEYLVPIYASVKALQNVLGDKSSNSDITTALTAAKTELNETQAVCDELNLQVDAAVVQLVESATQVDVSVDTALAAITTAAGRVNAAVVLASGEYDKCDTMLDLGEVDTEGAVNTSLAKIITEMDETQDVCDKIDADLVLAKAEIVLAKAEATEIATLTDSASGSSSLNVAVAAMKTELDKVDEIINLANDEFDEVSTQVSGSKDSPITDAFTEFEEAKNLSGAFNSGATATALGAMATELNKADNIVSKAEGQVDNFYTSIADIDDTNELWDATNKRFTAVRDALLQAQNLIDNDEPNSNYDAEANLADVDAAYTLMDAQLTDAGTVLGANPASGLIYDALTAMKNQADQSVQALANMGVEIGLANQEVDDALTEIAEAIGLVDNSSNIQVAVDGMKTANAKFRADGSDPALFGDESTYDTSDSAMTNVKTYVDRAISYINGDFPAAAYDLAANLADIDAELTSEDIDLGNARMQQLQSTLSAVRTDLDIASTYITEWNTMVDTLVKEINSFAAEANARYGWIDAKATVWQGELAAARGYTDVASSYLAQANGFNATVQAYSNQVQARFAYADSYMKASKARKDEGDSRVNQLNATVSVASQELARATVAISEINTLMSSYKLEIEGVSPYLQSAQTYISQAQGYAAEVQSYSLAGQTFINNGNAYLLEAQATIQAGNAYIQEAQARISQAQGYAAEVNARGAFTGAKSRAVDGFINTAQSYIATAQGFSNEVLSKIQIAQAYSSEVQIRLSQAQSKREESRSRIELGNAYLAEANSSANEAETYANEVSARISQVAGYGQVATGYINAAQGYANEILSKISIAQGYGNEIQLRLSVDTSHYGWYEKQQAKLQADYDKGLQVLIGARS